MATASSVGEMKDTLAQYEAQFHQVIDVTHSFVAMTTYISFKGGSSFDK